MTSIQTYDDRVIEKLLKKLYKKEPDFWVNAGVSIDHLGPPPTTTTTGGGTGGGTGGTGGGTGGTTTTPATTLPPIPAPTSSATGSLGHVIGDWYYETDGQLGKVTSVHTRGFNTELSIDFGISGGGTILYDPSDVTKYPGIPDANPTGGKMIQYKKGGVWVRKTLNDSIWVINGTLRYGADKIAKDEWTLNLRPLKNTTNFKTSGLYNRGDYVKPQIGGRNIRQNKYYYETTSGIVMGKGSEVRWNNDKQRYELGLVKGTTSSARIGVAELTEQPRSKFSDGQNIERSNGRGFFEVTGTTWDPSTKSWMVHADGLPGSGYSQGGFRTYDYNSEDIQPWMDDYIKAVQADIGKSNNPGNSKKLFTKTAHFLNTIHGDDALARDDITKLWASRGWMPAGTVSDPVSKWIEQVYMDYAYSDNVATLDADSIRKGANGSYRIDADGKLITLQNIITLSTDSDHTEISYLTSDGITHISTYGEFLSKTSLDSVQHVGNVFVGTAVHGVGVSPENGTVKSINDRGDTVITYPVAGDVTYTEHQILKLGMIRLGTIGSSSPVNAGVGSSSTVPPVGLTDQQITQLIDIYMNHEMPGTEKAADKSAALSEIWRTRKSTDSAAIDRYEAEHADITIDRTGGRRLGMSSTTDAGQDADDDTKVTKKEGADDTGDGDDGDDTDYSGWYTYKGPPDPSHGEMFIHIIRNDDGSWTTERYAPGNHGNKILVYSKRSTQMQGGIEQWIAENTGMNIGEEPSWGVTKKDDSTMTNPDGSPMPDADTGTGYTIGQPSSADPLDIIHKKFQDMRGITSKTIVRTVEGYYRGKYTVTTTGFASGPFTEKITTENMQEHMNDSSWQEVQEGIPLDDNQKNNPDKVEMSAANDVVTGIFHNENWVQGQDGLFYSADDMFNGNLVWKFGKYQDKQGRPVADGYKFDQIKGIFGDEAASGWGKYKADNFFQATTGEPLDFDSVATTESTGDSNKKSGGHT